MTWHAGHTAPKDGTLIIGVWNMHKIEHPHGATIGFTYYADEAWRDEGKLITAPDHWMPIPKLPE